MGWLLAAAILCGWPARAEGDGYPPESVLLFVASWCAPCHAELARLPAIASGAHPFRVLVVPFDDSRATRTMMEGVPAAQRGPADRITQRRLAKEALGGSSGLPFSVAVNADGQICASVRQGLDGTTARKLVERCARKD